MDKFKGTLSAQQAVDALAAGVADAAPQVRVERVPVADGGEGTLELLSMAMGLAQVKRVVRGPVGDMVPAAFGEGHDGSDGPAAVVELARAAGLALVPRGRRDPTRTTTYGVGELIRCAVERGAQRVIVALGGSGTCDGGVGLAQALGAKFRDRGGALLPMPLVGSELERIAFVEPVALAALGGAPVRLEAAVDVDSPLLGPRGAAQRFSPQKGATAAQVELLERGLAALSTARVLEDAGTLAGTAIAPALAELPGSGAAGGCGFGLVAFCGATLRAGAPLVLDALGFDEHVGRSFLVVTGEGRLDASSAAGKASVAVARAARLRGVPAIVVAGEIAEGAEALLGDSALFTEQISLIRRFGRAAAVAEAARCLHRVGQAIGERLR